MRLSMQMRGFLGLAIGVAISFHIVWAQKPGSPPGGGGASHGQPGNIPPGVPGRVEGPGPGSLNGSIYLIGDVVLDDGSPPPDPVTIERVCNGSPRAQAYTDRQGRFSFQVGQTAGIIQDASEDGAGMPGTMRPPASMINGSGLQQVQQPNTPDRLLANCDLRAVLAGYRSDNISLGMRRVMDDPNVGTIVLHRLAEVEGSAISVTSLQAPKEARRAYEKAREDLRKNKSAAARTELKKAVDAYPRYAAAWYELGRIQLAAQESEPAHQSFTNAVASDPKFVSPYLQLAEMAAKAANWTELSDVTTRLLKLDSVDYPMAYFYSATANLNLGQLDAAEKSALAGEKLDTPHRYPRLEQVLAVILARKKDYAGAITHLRNYLLLAPDAEDAERMRKQLAELEKL